MVPVKKIYIYNCYLTAFLSFYSLIKQQIQKIAQDLVEENVIQSEYEKKLKVCLFCYYYICQLSALICHRFM